MPSGDDLYAKDFIKALKKKHASGTYKSMVIYVEACEAGSIFDGLPPKGLNIYITTASNPSESSYATYCPDNDLAVPNEDNTCLGDLYSVKDRAGNAEEYSSHVMEYGDINLSGEFLAVYMGATSSSKHQGKYTPSMDAQEGSLTYLTSAADQHQADLVYLKEKVKVYTSHCGPLSTYGNKYMRAFSNICNAEPFPSRWRHFYGKHFSMEFQPGPIFSEEESFRIQMIAFVLGVEVFWKIPNTFFSSAIVPISKRQKMLWLVSCAALIWGMWIAHNEFIFQNRDISVDKVFEYAQIQSYNWLKVQGGGGRMEVQDRALIYFIGGIPISVVAEILCPGMTFFVFWWAAVCWFAASRGGPSILCLDVVFFQAHLVNTAVGGLLLQNSSMYPLVDKFPLSNTSKWWRNLHRVSHGIKGQKEWLNIGLKRIIGNAKEMRFWLDAWISERKLCDLFLRQFNIAADENALIAQEGEWHDESWR
ncbi:hypothetical protein Ancab_023000 [Ancistrocladus abbreviatus]